MLIKWFPVMADIPLAAFGGNRVDWKGTISDLLWSSIDCMVVLEIVHFKIFIIKFKLFVGKKLFFLQISAFDDRFCPLLPETSFSRASLRWSHNAATTLRSASIVGIDFLLLYAGSFRLIPATLIAYRILSVISERTRDALNERTSFFRENPFSFFVRLNSIYSVSQILHSSGSDSTIFQSRPFWTSTSRSSIHHLWSNTLLLPESVAE